MRIDGRGHPRGAYRLPTGGYMLPPTSHNGIRVQGILRKDIDAKRLALVLLDVAKTLHDDELNGRRS